MSAAGQVTALLSQLRAGNRGAMDELIPLVYKEFRLVAVAMMANERSGHTLQPTAVVNEAWVRMANSGNISPENRAHFFGIAAQSMRNVLVDHARRRLAAKRGGE